MRKNHPFNNTLAEGEIVTAGDVIGYMGMTGYSTKENVNNIKTPHLHFGMQLIFDESQKDGVNQIWIDVYHIVKLLQSNKSAVRKDPDLNDYYRVYNMIDPIVPD
jgi:murein DD-endopeptidase MepM/ murein hydrolase activator NlpD